MHNVRKLGVPRTWEVYIAVFLEVILTYASNRILKIRGDGAQLVSLTLVMGAFYLINEFLLSSEVVLSEHEIVVKQLGVFRRGLRVKAVDIALVSIEREYDPLLKIGLKDGTTITLGPWTRWDKAKRLRLLSSAKRDIDRFCSRFF